MGAKFILDNVSGIEETMKYMRLPKDSLSSTPVITSINDDDINNDLIYDGDPEYEGGVVVGLSDEDWDLASHLSVPRGATGHDNYLKGITVHLTVKAPHYVWNQLQRYHWFDIVSSTSKMHTLTKKPIAPECEQTVSRDTIYLLDVLIEMYHTWDETDHEYRVAVCDSEDIMYVPTTKSEWFRMILNNTPLGYNLTAGVVTNYLQLKTMYRQRKNHALSDWNTEFVNFIHSLPLNKLITGEK